VNLSPAKVFLETERMFFRQFQAEDAPLLFELDGDPEVMRFITKGKPTPLAKIQNEIIPRFLEYYRQSPPRGFWAAHLSKTGEFIGWFDLCPNKISPAEMELGYRLNRGVWGCGLATEGSRALIKKAFDEWGYEKISAHTMATNLASRRVMEKTGLAFECEFHYEVDVLHGWIEEEERRAVKYSITRAKILTTIEDRRA
jgi:RimJ/RimL family protein N-acetyltransferase